jgi:hypothetical protein
MLVDGYTLLHVLTALFEAAMGGSEERELLNPDPEVGAQESRETLTTFLCLISTSEKLDVVSIRI